MNVSRRSLGWVAAVVVVAVLIVVGITTFLRALASPSALWRIVQLCVAEQEQGHVPPGDCVSVDRKDNVAILRSIEGRWQYLAIPTTRVTGIEDPQVRDPRSPNYWALAWSAAERYLPPSVTKSRTNIALAINSVPGRSQNQLHIHISCIKPAVKSMLQADQNTIGTTWSRPFLDVGGQEYRVIRVQSPTLNGHNPFALLASLPGAAQHMGLHTLVVTGAAWNNGKSMGFYVLDDYAHDSAAGTDDGHGESLLDEDCAALT
jgi:CDP-diacylglycerol pyrophosphatase